MTNGQRGGYATKHPDEYYYDKLGPRVRKCLQECVTTWSARWCYKMMKEKGADYIIKTLREADHDFMKKGSKKYPSSYIAAKVKPLRANW